ncbi:NAD(+) diphosphatase [Aliikangiella sp. IMCC44359]|uniref:NAD(+) diphosphatase n=1 Tax=Aliikangiella sp. IMCC44359 TaxID=3459125 RepID=UPI00403ADBB2
MLEFPSINRNAEIRHDQLQIAELQQAPKSRHILWHKGHLLSQGDQDHYFSQHDISIYTEKLSTPIYLGQHESYTYFAYHVEQWHICFEKFEQTNLRAAGKLIDDYHIGLLFYSQGLLNWHKSHQYCAQCGSSTGITNSGHSRICKNTQCLKEHFPRIEPAVIFSVENKRNNEARLLLARQASWDENRYSVLAGFVEHGESLEQAVKREAAEEVGLTIDTVDYVASQPWPFPGSIMLGFECSTQTDTINLIDQELETAKWFTVKQIEAELKAGSLRMPYSVSISWHLVDRWYQKQTGKTLKSFLQTIK